MVEPVGEGNGRLRSKILARGDLTAGELKEFALQDPRIAYIISHQEVLKTIVVPDKLVNIV